MCNGNGIGHWITHSPITPPDHTPRFVRCQSMRQRPPAMTESYNLECSLESSERKEPR
jgi:hypothetical protein